MPVKCVHTIFKNDISSEDEKRIDPKKIPSSMIAFKNCNSSLFCLYCLTKIASRLKRISVNLYLAYHETLYVHMSYTFN